jgi:type II secretory pathway component GspD/PulD (secretin)
LVGFGLLGTNLLAPYVDYLKPYSKIIVALDPDAKRKTLQITSTLRSTFPNVYALNLQDDIKYRMPSDMAYLRKFAG